MKTKLNLNLNTRTLLKVTVLLLALITISTTTAAALSCSDCDICVNQSGWWRDGGALNASTTPIQAAVDNASSGDTICVAAGSYTENVNVNKRLTLEGAGAGVVTVTAASNDHVFEVTADYVNISGFRFTATGETGLKKAGIRLSSADHCNISENTASNNYYGIYLYSSSDNTLASNTADSNSGNGICLHYSSNNTLTSNTANSNNHRGIFLCSSCNHNTLTNNTADSNIYYGISLEFSCNHNTLTNNTASNSDQGISLEFSCNHNTLTSNNASNRYYGIYLHSSSNHNTLTSNNASNNYLGIYLYSSSDNTLSNNTANSNGYYGIYLRSSSDNHIYNNYFNNTNNAWDEGTNIWNITKTEGTNIIGGPYLGGNYWSDYSGVDNDGDGLGDTMLPYNSSGDIKNGGDWLPLTPPKNLPPVASANGPYTDNEGLPITFDASGSSDPDGDSLTYRWDFDNDGDWDTVWLDSATASYIGSDDFSGTAKVEVSDGTLTDTATASVTINNVAPTVGAISAPLDPVSVGIEINASAGFTDPGTLDTHTAVWDWGDDTTSPGIVDEIDGSGTVNGSHNYTTPGVYTVTLTVTDDDGDSDSAEYQYVVVYDPAGGFVTGGGWIDSPAGAYTPDPSLTGKATFGFVSKYKKGADTPTGETEFQFKVADLNFHSDSYDWLVIAGHKAMYKGNGTINGDGNYGFMLSAIDEKLTPSTDVDLFRIKIWDEDDEDAVVYDNDIENDDDADPATEIAGGQIVIHKK